jgi:hypothetical protein
MFGGPWSDPEDIGSEDTSKLNSTNSLDFSSLENCDVYYGAHGLWPRKRRLSERDAAVGLNTSAGLGAYLGIMGSRRDVVTAVWKTGLEGVWYKVTPFFFSLLFGFFFFVLILSVIFFLLFSHLFCRITELKRKIYFYVIGKFVSCI